MSFNNIEFNNKLQSNNKKEAFEKKCDNLDGMVEFYINEIKKSFEKYKEEDIVNEDGSINMNNYMRKKNGHYSKEEVKKDRRLKDEKMQDWAKYFYDIDDNADEVYLQEKTKEYRDIKKAGNGEKLEKLLFVNLNKILAPDYFVMHSSEYDDLSNGVDFVIVEADTGIVACGFDSVYDNKGGDRYKTKVKKLRKQSEHHGTNLKYGFIFEKEKIIKKELTNLPNFFLNMNLEDIRKLEKDMNYLVGKKQKPNNLELGIFDKLVISLDEQLKTYSENKNINPKVKDNLKIFDFVLEKIKKNRDAMFDI
ncbi:hypothetical protein KAI92_03150 [Candidatus Parcubacteria bacterium]|nr:hypothetical protein [Candidatus Parcubacteria bacterium]